MYRSHFLFKTLAIMAMMAFLNTLVAPTLLMATNSGPSAPEATGFEPVEATDMVNLISGDFSYVLPILNVPGPEGGYPINLSYHGGIAALQEASWVGLGWSMTPGAINRSVNGTPDDWKQKLRTGIVNDDGTTVEGRDISLQGSFGPLSIGYSRSYRNNVAISGQVALGINIPKTKIGVNTSIAYGEKFGLGTFINGVLFQGFLGKDGARTTSVFYTFEEKTQAKAGIGYSSNGSLHLLEQHSGTSAGIGISLKEGFAESFASNYSNDHIESSFNFQGATNYTTSVKSNVANEWDYFFLQWKDTRTTTKIWMHNELAKEYSGVLYYDESREDSQYGYDIQSRNYKTDVYYTPLDSSLSGSFEDIQQSTALMLPAYDGYSISGQGIGGSMSPKFYKHAYLVDEASIEKEELYYQGNHIGYTLKDQKFYLGNYTSFSKPKVHFTLNQMPESYLSISNGTFTFPGTPTMANDNDYTFGGGTLQSSWNGQSNYNATDQRRGASNYVEWFTNEEIVEQTSTALSKGYIGIPGEELNYTFSYSGPRSNYDIGEGIQTYYESDKNGIGAFQITVSDGKTYHYSLPVYNQVQVNRTYEGATSLNRFFEKREQNRYAYNWLLTAITGPDYYDANDNGLADEGDYGYWVTFNYGRFYNGSAWRSPFSGETKSEDSYKEWHSYTGGLKELYYLNSIQTRTHTAYFIKSERLDGLGWKTPGGTKLTENYSSVYYNVGNADKRIFSNCNDPSTVGIESDVPNDLPVHYTTELTVPDRSVPLKLDKIILLKNEDADLGIGGGYEPASGGLVEYYTVERFNDINAVANGWLNTTDPTQVSIHNTDLDYCRDEYSEFDANKKFNRVYDTYDLANYNASNPDLEEKAIGVVEFEYDYSLAGESENSNATGNGRLTLKQVKISGNGGASTLPPYLFSYYNDVDYDELEVDEWGYLANAWDQTMDEYTKTNVHQWSLKEITTPTGGKVKVNYESDTYRAEAIGYDGGSYWGQKAFGLRDIKKLTDHTYELTFYMLFPISNWFEENEYYHFSFDLVSLAAFNTGCTGGGGHNNSGTYQITNIDQGNRKITINIDDADPMIVHDGNNVLHCLNTSILKLKSENSLALSPGHLYPEYQTLHGGGIRVKSVELSDEEGNVYKTLYDYNSPLTGKTSGITSYNAATLNMKGVQKYVPYGGNIPSPGVMYEYVTVSGIGANGDPENMKTIYNFEVLPVSANTNDRNFRMGDFFKINNHQYSPTYEKELGGSYPGYFYARSATIEDNTSRLGRIKSVRHVTSNNHEVYLTEYRYNDNSGLGLSKETFSHKFMAEDEDAGLRYYQLVASSIEKSANYLEQVYTKSEGQDFTVYYEDLDFNTGQPLTKKYKDGFNSIYVEKTVPAYTISGYSEMGLKSTNANNKNMLSQTAENKLSFFELGKPEKVVASNVQTWKKSWNYRDFVSGNYTDVSESGVWRKHEQYNWKATRVELDGTYKSASTDAFIPFNWGGTPDNHWEKTSEVIRYDRYSHPIEMKVLENLNLSSGNIAYSATKRDESKGLVVLSADVAQYNEVAFSGAEFDLVHSNWFEGEVKKGNGAIDETKSHTGSKSMKTTGTETAFEFTAPEGDFNRYAKYLVTVWVYNGDNREDEAEIELSYLNSSGSEVLNIIGNYSASTYGSPEYVKAGNWTRMSFVTPNYDEYAALGTAVSMVVKVQGTVPSNVLYLDDFRLQPFHSTLNAYVYDEWDRISAILDDRNFATVYKYSNAGQLSEVHREFADETGLTGGLKKISEFDRHFARN